MTDRDFTHNRLRELYVSLLDHGYRTMPFLTYLEDPPSDPRFVIIRHDLDRNRKNALAIATLEEELSIRSSYYFRYPSMFDPALITAIAGMGHEIGYHYEVLAKTRGNVKDALVLFGEELEEFRKICPVKTICAHGSPLSPYDNRDLWKEDPFSRFAITGDAQLSISSPVAFFTDTGRSWDSRNNLRDSATNTTGHAGVSTTRDLIDYVDRTSPPALYLVIHPERWSAGGFDWYLQYGIDLAFNTGKKVIRWMR
jgi:hypothetical protein